LFSKIESAVAELLRTNIKNIPAESIGAKRKKQAAELPIISIVNVDFEFKEQGIGRSVPGDLESLETLNGDGKRTEFTLTQKILKPFIRVEHPPGTLLKDTEYRVDYAKNTLSFNIAPLKGAGNVLVEYRKPVEQKSLRLNLRYHIQVWASSPEERDDLTVQVMEILLRDDDVLSNQGIQITPVKGFNVATDDDVYVRSLEYLIQTDLTVAVELPRIEAVELQQKK
jgi:hypothetical protein